MPPTRSATRTRVTVSLPVDVARYLRSTPNASAVVREAVEAYRTRELARRLEEAYRADAAEAERINGELAGYGNASASHSPGCSTEPIGRTMCCRPACR